MKIITAVYKKLVNSATYTKFEKWVKSLKTNKDKGDAMEIFAKVFFISHRVQYAIDKYYSRLMDVIPEELGLHKKDVGTDGIIIHNDNKVTLVQVKYRSNNYKHPVREWIAGMALEGLAIKDRYKGLCVFSNTLFDNAKNISKKEKTMVTFILYEELSNCAWDLVRQCARKRLDGISFEKIQNLSVKPPESREWQTNAKNFVSKEFSQSNRAQVIAACGTGKTFMGYLIIKNKYKKALILVPNLHLLSQWFENLAAWDPRRKYLLVGSDADCGEYDERISFELTTDEHVIGDWLDKNATGRGMCVISTYQSLPRILECLKYRRVKGKNGFGLGFLFELTICDEAHMTCSTKKGSCFTLPALEPQSMWINGVPSLKFLYTTATPKVFKGKSSEDFYDMNDENVYGKRFTYSFAKAITDKIISDYKIILLVAVDLTCWLYTKEIRN